MTGDRQTSRLRDIVCWASFFILLVTYWVTTPESVSYWDCPEYVTAAYLLEVGHPPGNPLWMLVTHIFTLLAPTPRLAAYFVNLSSGLFTAFAGFLLANALFPVTLWLLRRRNTHRIRAEVAAAGVSVISALTFGWSDSAWYSAVEAEVYAMSIFFTALTVWLIVRWAFMHDRARANRCLVLLAYIFGLSLGVHQLNLLVIPALAVVWGLRRGIRSVPKLAVILLLGFLAVGSVLMGVMPGSISLAAEFELLFVNNWGLPPLSGVVAYLVMLGLSLLLALAVTSRSRERGVVAAAIYPAIFMSCVFAVKGQFLVSAAVSAIMAFLLVEPRHFDVRRLNMAFWMLAMLMTGYGCYALIPVRGFIPSPANPSMPGEPFAFAAYQAREQYGGAPLLYGETPYSKPMYQEEYDSVTGKPFYHRYITKRGHATIARYEPGARFSVRANGITPQDSAANARVINSGRPGYVVTGYTLSNILTPELNCWLPRITSRDPQDRASYSSWAGMDTDNMERVMISEAIDSVGRPVGRCDVSGRCDTVYSYRPRLSHNLRFLGAYQAGYMYARYLMWNFCGRQNDIPSQGEVEHGNFITGIMPVDNLMLGAEDSLPPEAGCDNPGRNRYFAVPLILGIIGIFWLGSRGRRGRAALAVTFLLFFMTGLAIVIYLNQGPGEARERDYSFLGSFWVFSAWVGFGALAVARMFRSPWVLAAMLLVPGWMCFENFDDHDRSGRHAAATIAESTLDTLEPDAILFVDGDNFTFPLWYAQEVEGIRRDVRVLNISYLSLASYAAGQLGAWRESMPLPVTLRRHDIIQGAFSHVRLAPDASASLPAVEIMKRLRDTPAGVAPTVTARFALIPMADGDTLKYDMRNLTASGSGGDIRQAQLLIFDMIATNAASGHGRPIYWMSNSDALSRLRISPDYLTSNLLNYRFGPTDTANLSGLAADVDKIRIPNRLDKPAYMDATPAKMTGYVRAALIRAARRQLNSGRLRDAMRSLEKADLQMGRTFNSYIFVADGDSVLDVRRELGRLQTALADSLDKPGVGPFVRFRAVELWSRGRDNILNAEKRIGQWTHYRRALPERLRPMTVPI